MEREESPSKAPYTNLAQVATVLMDELDGGICQEEIGEFGEFSHEGSEGDFGGFSCVSEALIERFEHGVVS